MRMLWWLVLAMACRSSGEPGAPTGPRLQITYAIDLAAAVDDRAVLLRAELAAALADRKIPARSCSAWRGSRS
jgi:hypothetical protein